MELSAVAGAAPRRFAIKVCEVRKHKAFTTIRGNIAAPEVPDRRLWMLRIASAVWLLRDPEREGSGPPDW